MFIQDQTADTNLKKIQPGEIEKSPNFYLLHNCVPKEDSTTTKLFIVFDVQDKRQTTIPVKNCLLVGPNFR